MRVRLDAVPLRDPALGPPEILMSESQERMMAVVEPADVPRFLAVCAKWDVQATVIGEVTGTGRLEMTWHGETVVDIPPGTAADEGPVYSRPLARPGWQDELAAGDPGALPRPSGASGLRATLLSLLGSPGLADKTWVTEQYDRYVRGDTVLAMPEDGGLIRVDEETGLGVALATDGNGRYALLDPYAGAQLALCEAYRNVAATGARPLAVTNCLNFGSPEDPAVMWQFAEAVRGPRRRLRRARRSRHRRQRQLLQPDRRGRHPADPGDRGAGRAPGRAPPAVHRLRRRRGPHRAARPHRSRVRRLRVGAGGARAPGRPAAAGRFRRRTDPGPGSRRRGRLRGGAGGP